MLIRLAMISTIFCNFSKLRIKQSCYNQGKPEYKYSKDNSRKSVYCAKGKDEKERNDRTYHPHDGGSYDKIKPLQPGGKQENLDYGSLLDLTFRSTGVFCSYLLQYYFLHNECLLNAIFFLHNERLINPRILHFQAPTKSFVERY